MKISESGSIRAQRLRRLGRSGGTSTDFARHLSAGDNDQAAVSQPVLGANSVGSVDSLLSLQEVGDGGNGRSKGLQRAADLLEQLDEIRHGLLMGGLSRDGLQELSRSVRRQRDQLNDPRLTEILDEIELRAAVELAKYNQTG